MRFFLASRRLTIVLVKGWPFYVAIVLWLTYKATHQLSSPYSGVGNFGLGDFTVLSLGYVSAIGDNGAVSYVWNAITPVRNKATVWESIVVDSLSRFLIAVMALTITSNFNLITSMRGAILAGILTMPWYVLGQVCARNFLARQKAEDANRENGWELDYGEGIARQSFMLRNIICFSSAVIASAALCILMLYYIIPDRFSVNNLKFFLLSFASLVAAFTAIIALFMPIARIVIDDAFVAYGQRFLIAACICILVLSQFIFWTSQYQSNGACNCGSIQALILTVCIFASGTSLGACILILTWRTRATEDVFS